MQEISLDVNASNVSQSILACNAESLTETPLYLCARRMAQTPAKDRHTLRQSIYLWHSQGLLDDAQTTTLHMVLQAQRDEAELRGMTRRSRALPYSRPLIGGTGRWPKPFEVEMRGHRKSSFSRLPYHKTLGMSEGVRSVLGAIKEIIVENAGKGSVRDAVCDAYVLEVSLRSTYSESTVHRAYREGVARKLISVEDRRAPDGSRNLSNIIRITHEEWISLIDYYDGTAEEPAETPAEEPAEEPAETPESEGSGCHAERAFEDKGLSKKPNRLARRKARSTNRGRAGNAEMRLGRPEPPPPKG